MEAHKKLDAQLHPHSLKEYESKLNEFIKIKTEKIEDFGDLKLKKEILESLKIKKLESLQEMHPPSLIVFIDDLDRCSPDKALEIFESLKIFFHIEGIVFVLGLSKEIVEAVYSSIIKLARKKTIDIL